MSFISNTAFEARDTNGALDQLANVAGKYQTGDPLAATDCSAGQLCVKAGKAPNEAFDNPSGTRVYNEYTFIFTTATSAVTADTPVYAFDSHNWPIVTNQNGNKFAVGVETLGLGLPAGGYGNFHLVKFDGVSVYRFGIGNLSASLGANTYFTISNAGLLTPAASAPTTTGAVYFTLEGTGNFTEGTTASFGYVDVIGHKVSTVAG